MFQLGSLALAVVLSQPQTGPARTPAETEDTYWKTVEEYSRNGDGRTRALLIIKSWSEKSLEAIVRSVEKLSRAAHGCSACEARGKFEALPLRAAVLLHAERDRVDRLDGISRNGDTDCTVGTHGLVSLRLMKVAFLQKDGPIFVPRFAMGMALHHRAVYCFANARAWAQSGLESDEKNPGLLMARGFADETAGTIGQPQPSPVGDIDLRFRPPTVSLAAARRAQLDLAREAFEKAIGSAPALREARLHLGRVLWRLGRLDDARKTLAKTMSEAESPVLYLAHLFLGQVLEDSRDIDGAVSEYRAAVALKPTTQIAAVALAHAFTLRGDSDRARDVLESVLPFAGRRRTVDPYGDYLVGTTQAAEDFLDLLRIEWLR